MSCDIIRKMRLKQFRGQAEQNEYIELAQKHKGAIRAWRKLEMSLIAAADHSPSEVITITCYDISPVEFPTFTKRPFKSQTQARYRMIPMLVNAVTEKYYVLMPKDKWKKGANRLITTLHRILRAIKNNPQHKHFSAKRLNLYFDNASENQNNTMLKFYSDLVARGWFDDVFVFFGAVGHTHGGADRPHHVLNSVSGVLNMSNPTLVQLVNNFDVVWKTKRTRPEPLVLDCIYNWKGYYSSCAANTHYQSSLGNSPR